MHVRLRLPGKPETIIVVESKLTKIEQFRRLIKDKLGVETTLQRLFYGGKLLEDGYTFHDYNIKLNDVIQLMVRIQSQESLEIVKTEHINKEITISKNGDSDIGYIDTNSVLYAVGDLIDMKDREQGAWFEGKIARIVRDPKTSTINTNDSASDSTSNCSTKALKDKENDSEKTNILSGGSVSDTKKNSILKYFNNANIRKKQAQKETESNNDTESTDESILYKILLDDDEEDSNIYCNLSEIRPRARTVIDIKDLKTGQKVMLNYNTHEPSEKGYWYDFTVCEIKMLRSSYELIGTLYLGSDSVTQNDTKIKVHDKIYAIDEVVPLKERTDEYNRMMVMPTEKRSLPLKCMTCHDNEDTPCKDCGCYLCSGKELPEKTVLCDECNKGFHMKCLDPPLTDLPEEDWYCPTCKRDPNDVIAPGAAKQLKKVLKSKKDWGRGMACAGKTKTCAMPPNHFGPIPGIEVGMCWRFRIQLSESGIHRPPVSGIHGRDVHGAYSIVLSGGYEDDVDNGNEFTYTGSGGRDLSGNKRTAEQSCDQTLTRENRALARNCAVKQITEDGGDAGDNWQSGKPVRVVRSYKMLKHFPKYAPKEGIRYDGIYKVVKYYPEKGLSGYRVWKYLLRRDDPNPAPWEPGAKQFPIIYPDGFLEAEAEKKAQKEKKSKNTKASKKRRLEAKDKSGSDLEPSPPGKKRKLASIFTTTSPKVTKPANELETTISAEERNIIKADSMNSKLWDECLEICKNQGRKQFVEHVTQVFLCIICQDVPVSPVTTPCLHNFCMGCLKLAFKSTGSKACPCCRRSLSEYTPEINDTLKTGLQSVMPGYDAGKK